MVVTSVEEFAVPWLLSPVSENLRRINESNEQLLLRRNSLNSIRKDGIFATTYAESHSLAVTIPVRSVITKGPAQPVSSRHSMRLEELSHFQRTGADSV